MREFSLEPRKLTGNLNFSIKEKSKLRRSTHSEIDFDWIWLICCSSYTFESLTIVSLVIKSTTTDTLQIDDDWMCAADARRVVCRAWLDENKIQNLTLSPTNENKFSRVVGELIFMISSFTLIGFLKLIAEVSKICATFSFVIICEEIHESIRKSSHRLRRCLSFPLTNFFVSLYNIKENNLESHLCFLTSTLMSH